MTTIKHGCQDNLNAAILSRAVVWQYRGVDRAKGVCDGELTGMLTAITPLS